VLFDDPQLKRPDSQPGQELYWLLGCDGVDHFNRLATTDPDGFTHLPDSGYVVARQGGDWLCFDAGPIAHGLHADATPSTAHGHLDTLQLLYCHKDQPVLTDPGMPFYFQDREWVRHFRSAAAHASVEIDRLPLAQDAGRLEWSNVVSVSEFECGGEVAPWSGRAVVKFAPDTGSANSRWERHFLCIPGVGLWVLDQIDLPEPSHARFCWPLDSSITVEQDNSKFRLQLPSGDSMVLEAACNETGMNAELLHGTGDSPVANVASGYGTFEGSKAVAVEFEAGGECLILTSLQRGGTRIELEFCGRRFTNHDGRLVGSSRQSSKKQIRSGLVIWHLMDALPEDKRRSPDSCRFSSVTRDDNQVGFIS
jgi:hypothetical protein